MAEGDLKEDVLYEQLIEFAAQVALLNVTLFQISGFYRDRLAYLKFRRS